MVGGKVDGQNLAGTRSEKPKIFAGTRDEKRKNLSGTKLHFRKKVPGSQRVKAQELFDAILVGAGHFDTQFFIYLNYFYHIT